MQQDTAETMHMEEFFSEVSAIKVKSDHNDIVRNKISRFSVLRVFAAGSTHQHQSAPGQAAGRS